MAWISIKKGKHHGKNKDFEGLLNSCFGLVEDATVAGRKMVTSSGDVICGIC